MNRGVFHLAKLAVALCLGLIAAGCITSPASTTEPPPIIPATTAVADSATRTALSAYDPTTGTLRFSSTTPALENLKPDDVIVSLPSNAAPDGYLRQVKAIRREDGAVILETTQAALTDAISEGSLDVQHTLEPSELRSAQGLERGVSARVRPQAGVGDGFRYEVNFDETMLDFNEGNVKARIKMTGSLRFNAGYGLNFEIRGPRLFPPRLPAFRGFKASVGFDQSSNLRVSGNANAKIKKEKRVAEYRFSPQCFAILIVPVCVVPTIYVSVGISGEVNLRFDYTADQSARAEIGARWTPDNGWQKIDPTPVFEMSFKQALDINATVKARAQVRAEAALMIYGVGGPSIGVALGAEVDAALQRNPRWIARVTLEAYYGVILDLPILGRIAEHRETLYNLSKEIARAPNAAPAVTLTNRAARVELGLPVNLAPGCDQPGNSFYLARDPEDGCAVTASVVSDRDGALAAEHVFTTEGLRTLTATVRDSSGATASVAFTVNVVNTPPALAVEYFGDPRQGEEYAFAVIPSDPNERDLVALCANTTWSVDAPDALLSATGCLIRIRFASTGNRAVRLSTRDPQGATATRSLTVNVLPPPVDPFPRIKSGGAFSDEAFPSLGTCKQAPVTLGALIDLRGRACTLYVGNGGNRYSVRLEVENPSGEGLTYDWQLRSGASGETVLLEETASSLPIFILWNRQTSAPVTDNCQVRVRVNAPDSTRSKTETVWTGRCTYNTR
jgi:hypothetical protein